MYACMQPDVAAPGVDILAAWSPAASDYLQTDNKLKPLNFKIESGTSMACPHVSGIVALVKAIYPTWSPAAIKSALITTGKKDPPDITHTHIYSYEMFWFLIWYITKQRFKPMTTY